MACKSCGKASLTRLLLTNLVLSEYTKHRHTKQQSKPILISALNCSTVLLWLGFLPCPSGVVSAQHFPADALNGFVLAWLEDFAPAVLGFPVDNAWPPAWPVVFPLAVPGFAVVQPPAWIVVSDSAVVGSFVVFFHAYFVTFAHAVLQAANKKRKWTIQMLIQLLRHQRLLKLLETRANTAEKPRAATTKACK